MDKNTLFFAFSEKYNDLIVTIQPDIVKVNQTFKKIDELLIMTA